MWQVWILCFLTDLSLCGHFPCCIGGGTLVRCSKRFRAGCVPHKRLSCWPGHDWNTIRLLPVDSWKAYRCSSCEGMLAEARALWMMSFKAACLGDLPLLYIHLSPCLPKESTPCLQLQHLWGIHRGVPRRSPTAILTESSSRRKPKEESGSAFNQAPDSLRDAAKSLALSPQSWAPSNSLAEASSTLGWSHNFCWAALPPKGGMM